MSKIKICALGGLGENGKNMYAVDVDNNIFIFDAGLKYPSDTFYGIDYIIPSYDYIKENKEKIHGIFLTHGHDENMGAIVDIIQEIPSIKVYATNLTTRIIKKDLEYNKVSYNNFVLVKAHEKINFPHSLSIYPIAMTHSIPDAVGYALNTKDGIIYYTGDFTFDGAALEGYKMDIGKLAYLGKLGVLCLLSESVYAGREDHTSPNHRLKSFIKEILHKNDRRIIFNVLASSVYRLQELFDELVKTNRKVVILGKRLQEIINECIDGGYLKVDKKIFGGLGDIDTFNSVVLISNEREKPYVNIERIVAGYDKFIKLKDTDTVAFLFPSCELTEKQAVNVAEKIAKMGANVVTLSSKKHLSMHASREDLMMMINIMNPKYYMPVKGEYRHQVMNADAASLVGIKDENIILKQNGEVVCFENGKLVHTEEKVVADSIFIDGKANNDIGQLVLKDRELLSNNGIVVVSTTVDRKSKKLLTNVDVSTKGFLFLKNNSELVNEIRDLSTVVIEKNITAKYIDKNTIRSEIREVVGKHIYKETESRPMIITIIAEV